MEFKAIIETLICYFPMLALGMFLLVSAVQIIVEVIKGMLPKLPTAILVFIVSIAVCVLTLYIVAAVMEITVMWYYAVGAVVLGIFVAHAAMNGWDKYKEIYARIKGFAVK